MNRREVLVGGAMLGAAGLLDRSALAAKSDLVATTTAGKVRGRDAGAGVLCFKGIAYGQDTAQTRFAAPKPPAPWKEIRDASDWGPRSP
jgi:para-nitrobenzyl esterase